jgi:hypothetical protein
LSASTPGGGEYCHLVMFSLSPDADGNPRWVEFGEPQESEPLDPALIKQITGRDTLCARAAPVYEFVPAAGSEGAGGNAAVQYTTVLIDAAEKPAFDADAESERLRELWCKSERRWAAEREHAAKLNAHSSWRPKASPTTAMTDCNIPTPTAMDLLRTKLMAGLPEFWDPESGVPPPEPPLGTSVEWSADWKEYKAMCAEREVGAVAKRAAASAPFGPEYQAELEAQQLLWKEVTERNRAAEQARADAAFRVQAEGEAAVKKEARRVTKLEQEVVRQKGRVELWEKVVRVSSAKEAEMERKVKRRRAAKAVRGEFSFGASMVAQRLWERTGRSDWAAVVRMQGFDGLDVMDMTLDDVMSLGLDGKGESRDVNGSRDACAQAKAFLGAVIGLRDALTRPVAELVCVLRDHGAAPPETLHVPGAHDVNGSRAACAQANWKEAQALLKAGFAIGPEYGDPGETRLAAVEDVVRRFGATGDREARMLSVVRAVEEALGP